MFRNLYLQITNSKLQKGIGITRTMRHFLQKKQLKLLFSAFISPFLDYGALKKKVKKNNKAYDV